MKKQDQKMACYSPFMEILFQVVEEPDHRVRTYIECDRITTLVPMESADQAAWAGGRVSTTWS